MGISNFETYESLSSTKLADAFKIQEMPDLILGEADVEPNVTDGPNERLPYIVTFSMGRLNTHLNDSFEGDPGA